MEKAEISVEGLRILRTEGEIVLKEWARAAPEGVTEDRRGDLREAVREASARIEEAQARRAQRDKE